MTDVSPWWAPHVYADRREFLKARGAIRRACAAFFDREGFLEVETPILQTTPGAEIHLSAFSTLLKDEAGGLSRLYLHTSPEIACKKLLAAGEANIFTFAHCFRNGERSALHHPEFTMLEWYRAGAPYGRAMADCAALLAGAAEVAGGTIARWRGREADLTAPPERLSVAQAFSRFAGLDLVGLLEDRDGLAAAARGLGLRVGADDDWSDLFSAILSARIEPELGVGRPTFLVDYPAREAALARLKPDDPRFAERFELYVCGVELANGFGELADPLEQRRRFEAAMAEKYRRYGDAWPLDEDFIAALAAMPEAAGVALGFDRLVLLAAGATHIEQVLFAPAPAGTTRGKTPRETA